MPDPDHRLDVTAYDVVSPAAALEVVRPLCGSPAWLDAMVARRPLRTIERALEISDAVVATLSAQQLELAVAAESDLDVPAHDNRVQQHLAVRAAVTARVRQRLIAALA